MRYRLRTLMFLLAVLPPFLAWWAWPPMQRILWPPAFGPEVSLGMTRNQVRAILGTPNARSQSQWVFWGKRGTCSYRISVEFDGNTVQSIGSAETFDD